MLKNFFRKKKSRKIEDIEETQEILNSRRLFKCKISEISKIIESYEDNNGYDFVCSDKNLLLESERQISLKGCYVGKDCYKAILEILEEKLNSLDKELQKLGFKI